MSQAVQTKWTFKSALDRADAALALSTRYRPQVEPRFTAGLIDQLKGTLEALRETASDRTVAKVAQKKTTKTERELAKEGRDWIMTVRKAAKKTRDIKASELEALGVGLKVSDTVTEQVRSAIKVILTAFSEHEGLQQRIGIVAEDITEVEAIIAGLTSADSAQTEVMFGGKKQTFDKNALQLKVEAAVDEISTRGAIAFRQDKRVRKLFEALISKSGPKRQPPSGEEPPGEEPPGEEPPA